MINCFLFCFNSAFNVSLRRYIEGYSKPNAIVLRVVLALLIVLDERALFKALGPALTAIPADAAAVWALARRAIDLNMRSPAYIVARMQAFKRGDTPGGGGGGDVGRRLRAAEEIIGDVSYKEARQGSHAAAILWKWVLLVLAERKVDADAAADATADRDQGAAC
jgi:hypothetical protein